MSDADCTHDSALAAGKVEDELAVVHRLGLEYGEGLTSESVTPVYEAGEKRHYGCLTGPGACLLMF